MTADPRLVAIVDSGQMSYSRRPPFHPHEAFPEMPYARHELDPANRIYGAVRELLHLLALDAENYGTGDWNPLGEFVHPGDRVVIKPNFVREAIKDETDIDAIVTHGSVIRPIVDYCEIALKGEGHLVVADSPQFDSDFDKIVTENGTREMVKWINACATPKVDLLDLRAERVEYEGNVVVRRHKLAGDPEGYTTVNLGSASTFANVERLMPRIYGADYDTNETRKHHVQGVHEYLVSNTVLGADFFVCVPKLKTHKKAGITVSLKNAIGIIGDKNYLPHHRIGPASHGGDEFEGESLRKRAKSAAYNTVLRTMAKMPSTAKVLRVPGAAYSVVSASGMGGYEAGNWYGNDTIWRTTLDLNRILLFAGKDGTLDNNRRRRYISIVDGIIAGEREGPLDPSAKPTGLLLAGSDPVVVDMTCSQLMGFAYERIPTIRESLVHRELGLGGAEPRRIRVASNDPKWSRLWNDQSASLKFEPHSGWTPALEAKVDDS